MRKREIREKRDSTADKTDGWIDGDDDPPDQNLARTKEGHDFGTIDAAGRERYQ